MVPELDARLWEASGPAQDQPDVLQALRAAIRSGQIRKLTLLFRDGLRADIERSHALRFWRRDSSLLDEGSQ